MCLTEWEIKSCKYGLKIIVMNTLWDMAHSYLNRDLSEEWKKKIVHHDHEFIFSVSHHNQFEIDCVDLSLEAVIDVYKLFNQYTDPTPTGASALAKEFQQICDLMIVNSVQST